MNFKRLSKSVISTLLLLSLLQFVAACGGDSNGFLPMVTYVKPKNSTGVDKTVQNPHTGELVQTTYTSSGRVIQLDNLKKKVADNSDHELAGEVMGVTITPLDKNKNITRLQPSYLKIDLQLKPRDMTNIYFSFTGLLTDSVQPEAKSLFPESISGFDKEDFLLNLKCFQKDCRVIEILLKRFSHGEQASKLSSQVGILYSRVKTNVRIQSKLSKSNPNQKLAYLSQAAKKQRLHSEKTSFQVINGISHASVKIFNLDDKEKIIADIDTDLLAPNESPIEVSTVRIHSGSQQNGRNNTADSTVAGELVGSNFDTGKLTVDLVAKESNGKENPEAEEQVVRIHITETEGTKEDDNSLDYNSSLDDLEAAKETSLFRIDTNNEKLSSALDQSLKLQAYHNNKTVKEFITMWQNPPKRKACTHCYMPSVYRAEKFFKYSKPVSKYISKSLELIDVTPEAGYLLAIESTFGSDDAYNSKAYNNTSSAKGIWQIIDQTAKNQQAPLRSIGIDFTVYSNGKGNNLRSDDGRGYVIPATLAAGMYLKKLFSKYPSDPAVPFVAYHLGENSRAIKRFDTTLKEAEANNMLSQKGRYYVYSFLSLKVIGTNPEAFGFEADSEEIHDDRFIKTLYPPQMPKLISI